MGHRNFLQQIVAAREVSTPQVSVRTLDNSGTVDAIRKAFDELEVAKQSGVETPYVAWDCIHGLHAKNDKGGTLIPAMLQMARIEQDATVDAASALAALEHAGEDCVVFFHNPQLLWQNDRRIVQGIMNLRNNYKANGCMFIMLFTPGDTLQSELQSDVLMLEHELPTNTEIEQIILDTYAFAAKKYPACKKGPSKDKLKAAVKACSGLPAFPIEQAAAMELNKETGDLNVAGLWDRKRSIIGQMPGVEFYQGKETLADMAGNDAVKKFGLQIMNGPKSANLILRVDEIEKQFGGSSDENGGGVKRNMLGEFLSWLEDNRVICSLFLGVPGSSKSWFTKCIAGEFGVPLINYNIDAMQDQYVGNSGKNMRNAQRTVEAISDRKIWLIATANSLRGLPAELISRFSIGGIWFFDVPSEEEKQAIMGLKVKSYKLDAQKYPDMSDWTGRDIENCAAKAEALACTLIEAGRYVLPLLRSHHEAMDELRQSAHDRFLSSSHDGAYQYTPVSKAPTKVPETINGRKMR